MSSEPFGGWTVYDHPRDYPTEFVARRWHLHPTDPRGIVQTSDLLRAGSLESLRSLMRSAGLVCLPRSEGDDSVIVEVWI